VQSDVRPSVHWGPSRSSGGRDRPGSPSLGIHQRDQGSRRSCGCRRRPSRAEAVTSARCGPPGPCMTPSSVTGVTAMTLPIERTPQPCRADPPEAKSQTLAVNRPSGHPEVSCDAQVESPEAPSRAGNCREPQAGRATAPRSTPMRAQTSVRPLQGARPPDLTLPACVSRGTSRWS
jgi:hypothetical protein